MAILPTRSSAQIDITWSDEIEVNGNFDYGFSRPKLALTSNGDPVVMWGKRNNLDVYVSRYKDGKFLEPVKVTPNGISAFAQDWLGPDMVAYGDTIYVAFEAEPEGTGLIYVVRSIDGGLSFGDTVRVSANPQTRFPALSVSPDGTLFVALMEFEPGYKEPHYAVAVSKDGGQSFSEAVKGSGIAPGEVCDCCPAYLLSNEQATTLFFRNNDDNLRDIWAARSIDGGKSFPKAKEIDNSNWMIGACPSSGPSAIYYKDSLATVWMSAASGSSRAMIGSASEVGLDLGFNALLTPNAPSTANQNFPIIAGKWDVTGVVWQESNNGKSYLQFVSTDKGLMDLVGQTPITVNEGVSNIPRNPQMKYENGVFHLTWQDLRSQSIKYRKGSIVNFVGVSEATKQTVKAYPNPSGEYVTIENEMPMDRIEVLDATGKMLKVTSLNGAQQHRLDVSGLTPNLYFIRIYSNNEIKHLIISKL